MSSADDARAVADQAAADIHTDLWGAFFTDVINDCINGQGGPMEWPKTTAALDAERRDEARQADA